MLEDVLGKYGASEVSAMEMYGDIFRLGTGFIQRSPEIGSKVHKANPIILGSFDGVIRRRILFDDRYEEILREFQEADWAITNGLTYWGHANRADAQSKMCAMAFDLDGQDDTKLNTFLHGAFGGGELHEHVAAITIVVNHRFHAVELAYHAIQAFLQVFLHLHAARRCLVVATASLLRTLAIGRIFAHGVSFQSERTKGTCSDSHIPP